VDRDFDPACEDAERLVPFLAFAKDDLPLAEKLFAHERKG